MPRPASTGRRDEVRVYSERQRRIADACTGIERSPRPRKGANPRFHRQDRPYFDNESSARLLNEWLKRQRPVTPKFRDYIGIQNIHSVENRRFPMLPASAMRGISRLQTWLWSERTLAKRPRPFLVKLSTFRDRYEYRFDHRACATSGGRLRRRSQLAMAVPLSCNGIERMMPPILG